MTGKEKETALILDDNDVFRARLCRAFRLRGWEAYEAADIATALQRARETKPGLAVVDLRMGSESGLDAVRHLRALDGTMSILILTGYGSIATALEAIKCGADHYLTKPADLDQILTAYKRSGAPASSAVSPPATVPSLARVEWEHVQRVLNDCGGNVSQTARLLGVHRRSLQRKLSKNPPRE